MEHQNGQYSSKNDHVIMQVIIVFGIELIMNFRFGSNLKITCVSKILEYEVLCILRKSTMSLLYV